MMTKADVRKVVTMCYDDDAIRTSKEGILWNPKNGNFSNNGEFMTRVLLIVGENPKKPDDFITLGASLLKVQLREERNGKHNFFNVMENKIVENPFKLIAKESDTKSDKKSKTKKVEDNEEEAEEE